MAGIAFAYVSSTGAGGGTGHVGSLAPPSDIVVRDTGAEVTIGWTPVTAPSTGAVTYQVIRGGKRPVQVCGFPKPIRTATCVDSASSGEYVYTVIASWKTLTSSSTSSELYVSDAAATPASGVVASTVTVSGSNFPPDTALKASFGSTPVTLSAAKTNSHGDFSDVTFSVPSHSVDSGSGSHILKLTAGTTSSSTTFTIDPHLLVVGNRVGGATSGVPGTSVRVAGNGFAPNANSLEVVFGGTRHLLAGRTDAAGTLSAGASFIVPSVPHQTGGYAVAIFDGIGTSQNYVTNYLVEPHLLSVGDSVGGATSGVPGDTVSVAGNGFAPNATGLSVIFGGTNYALSGSTDAAGTISRGAAFVVPAVPHQSRGYPVAVSDGTETSKAFAIPYSIVPEVVLSPTSGTSGTAIFVTGDGFAANAGLSVTFGGTRVPWTSSGGAEQSDALGSIPALAATSAPAVAPGSYSVTVADAYGDVATTTYVIA